MNLYRYPQFTDTIIDYLPIIWIVPQPRSKCVFFGEGNAMFRYDQRTSGRRTATTSQSVPAKSPDGR